MLKLFTNSSSTFLRCSKTIIEPIRTTFVLKRKRNIRLSKLGSLYPRKLKGRQFYYELIENQNCVKKELLELVLLKNVPGVGLLGEKIQTKPLSGYWNLILPKLAVYASSPEALSTVHSTEDVQYSSKYFKIVEKHLLINPVKIMLNNENKWCLEPWHVKLALRLSGVIVNEECITLPKNTISGPDPDIEDKDFIVKVTMNKSECIPIRCRIYHLNLLESSQSLTEKTIDLNIDPLFPEDREEINKIIEIEKALKIKK